MSAFRKNNEITTASWPKQTAKRVMIRWQMDGFFLIPYKEVYRQGQRWGHTHLLILPRAIGTTWAVTWVSLCPGARAFSAQALLSLSAGLSLNPLCQDWINWADGHLGCFPRDKENPVVQRHFGGWGRVKSNTKTWTRGAWRNTDRPMSWLQDKCSWAVAWGLVVYRAQRSGNRVARSRGSGNLREKQQGSSVAPSLLSGGRVPSEVGPSH